MIPLDRHFKAYNDLLHRINDKNMELIQLKENWYNISGVKYSDVKSTGGKIPDVADQLHFIVEKEKELKALINHKEELRRIHEIEIDKLGNAKKRTVLKLFYLDKFTIKEIAVSLKCSDGHIKKLKRWGVAEFLEKNKL